MTKTLIYIIGAGRSGTTLLDIVLGNNKNSISLGEINRYFRRKGIPPKRTPQDPVFSFWKSIKNKIDGKIINTNYEDLDKVFNKNEYHSGILKSFKKKNDQRYIEALKAQYISLCELAEENVLIESSKYPVRALNLSNYISGENLEIKYIFIKKDPVKVVESFNKKDVEQPHKGFFASNLYYLVVNLLCGKVVRTLVKRGHKVFKLKYEDFMENPEAMLNELANGIEVNFDEVKSKISNNSPLKTGFLFDGNRIRLKETLLLQARNQEIAKNVKYYFTRLFNYIVYKK